jgi:hypothetical protein
MVRVTGVGACFAKGLLDAWPLFNKMQLPLFCHPQLAHGATALE